MGCSSTYGYLFFLYQLPLLLISVQTCLPLVERNVLYFVGIFFGFSFLFEKVYKDKFRFYDKQWKNESKTVRLVKGLIIFTATLGSFIGIFVIANEFHKMRYGSI